MDERRFNARGELVVESEATASILVNGKHIMKPLLATGRLMQLIQQSEKR